MSWFYNLTTMKKLVLGFLAVAAIAGAVGYMGVANVAMLDTALDDMYQQQLKGVSEIKEINAQIMYLAREIREAIITTDKSQVRKHRENCDKFFATMRENMDAVEKKLATGEGKRRFGLLKETVPVYAKVVDRVLELAAANRANRRPRQSGKPARPSRQCSTSRLNSFVREKELQRRRMPSARHALPTPG